MDVVTPEIAAAVAIVIAVAQFIGKVIPDHATGVLGFVRKIAKVIGIYVSNQK
jgi:hypothetical protein